MFLFSGAIGMIPWGSNESEAYDGYYLRPQGARVPAGKWNRVNVKLNNATCLE